jgi:hypothetical protein
MHVALLYFGKTRSIRYTYQTHQIHVFDKLKGAGITYDNYMHTWDTSHNMIWHNDSGIPEDEDSYALLEPAYFKKDNQADFLKTVDMSKYFYSNVNVNDLRIYSREWLFDSRLIRNHICALESQGRAFQMAEETGIHYDAYIVIRPDAHFSSDLDIHELQTVQENSVYIPDWDHWMGYNDRFAFGCKEAIRKYTHRVDDLEEFRATKGPLTSEKATKLMIEKYGFQMKPLTVRFRLCRPDGKLG